jgi:hypothetical protein
MVPPGPGGPLRPGTGRPTGTFAAPPPQVSFHGGPHYGGVVPGVIPAPPGAPYMPTPSGSPVIPSPPSTGGGDVFVPLEFHHFRDSSPPPPHGVYQPPVPVPLGDEDMFIPPEPSQQGSSRTPSRSESRTTSSPRPESGIPLVIPGPGPHVFPQPLQQGLQPHPGSQPPLLV